MSMSELENAAASLVAAVQHDATSTSATKRYQFACLCHEESMPNPSQNNREKDLPFALAFCEKTASHGTLVEGDATLCAWWHQQEAKSREQARHRNLAGNFVKHLLSEAYAGPSKAWEAESDAPGRDCAECAAAMQEEVEELPEPKSFPPSLRRLRPVRLEELGKPVTVQQVKKALSRIMAHSSLSCKMRSEASRVMDQASATSNFAAAIGAMLKSAGGLWQWGDGAALPPHRHAIHGLKKCRLFREPTTVLMMTFLEVLTNRLLSEVSKSLNPLQRWRHKHEVKGSASVVRAALSCSPAQRSSAQTLESRLASLQNARLQLRQRFDFPLSQGFCYDGAGDGFGKLFTGLRVEVELCRACVCRVNLEQQIDGKDGKDRQEDKCESESCDLSDADALSENPPEEFEFVGEALTALKADLQCCSNTMPHSLLLHCLKELGFDCKWLAFFTSYLEVPLHSGKGKKRGMPLGPSLSTLLLEIVGCFLDLWLHRSFLHKPKTGSPAAAAAPASTSPVLASLRCGDDIWLVMRTADAPHVWASFKQLYRACGLVLNLEDSGSVSFGGLSAGSSPLPELPQRPCWSLLQLMPDCSWTVATWRLAPRVSRALAEVETSGLSMLQRINLFNRHMDALLRQGGFHADLHDVLHPLHACIASLFQQAIQNATLHFSTSKAGEPEENTVSQLLSSLLWWPPQSGGLGARHLAMALHCDDNRLEPLLPCNLRSESPWETHVHSALQVNLPRNDRYESHLRTLLRPLIEDLFGTAVVLDSRYAALLE